MSLILVGLNHRSAPVEVREKIAISERSIPDALRRLRKEFDIREGMIFSTCNRVEVLAHAREPEPGVERVREFLHAFHRMKRPLLDPYIYHLVQREAVRHLFRVASSLDSMVLGEPQVLGQLKRAFAMAQGSGSAGTHLHRALHRAFFVAKRVRRETGVGNAAVSVGYVAVELARKIFEGLEDKAVLMLGAGAMAEAAVRNLARSGVSRVYIANRTVERSKDLARRVGGTPVPFEQREAYLEESDIVIVSTGASHFVLDHPLLDRIIRKRRYNPLFVIDISVPRNVDPRVNEIENIFLFDIDDLQSVVDANFAERHREARVAEEIIGEEVQAFLVRSATAETGPILGEVRRCLERICLSDLERNRHRMDPEEYERMRRSLLRTAHRIAHPLLMELKRNGASGPDPLRLLESLRAALNRDSEK